METPQYLVINPMRIEIEDAPNKNDPFKRYAWWDGTMVKVNKTYKEPYYAQAWKPELILDYEKRYIQFYEKLEKLKNISLYLETIKEIK